ncbi:MAG: transcriptional regulator, Crp/Fnr family, partial [Chloroflexi bacterium]|nr:transcriptional regulator, Crp/Fnr family [Chloroflexota bacterium]
VRAYMLSVDGRRITLGTLSPGTAFWIEPTDLEGSATCCNEVLLDGTLLCRLPHDYVRRLMARNPQFAVEVYEVVYMWCATFRDRLRELAHDHTGTRLAHLLGRLAASSDCNVVYETHDELAWWIGTSRARVTKELHRLRGLGLIAYRPHGRGIHVLDPARLRTLQL